MMEQQQRKLQVLSIFKDMYAARSGDDTPPNWEMEQQLVLAAIRLNDYIDAQLIKVSTTKL